MAYELTLRSLRALVAVADTGSVRRAAEQMHLTQPALSQHLARISEIYGAPVTERRGRGIQLTEIGRIVVAYARDVERCLDSASSAVANLHGLTRGRVRIGVLQSVNMHLIPRTLARLAQLHPGIRMMVHELSGEQIEQGVISGSLDLGVGLARMVHDNVRTIRLYAETLVLVGHHDDDMDTDSPISLTDVCEMPLALLSDEFTTRQLINFYSSEADIVLRPSIETNTISSLLELVRGGGFRTLLPYSALTGTQTAGLCHVPLIRPQIKRTVSILRREESVATPAAASFMAVLRQVASELVLEHPILVSVGRRP